MRAKLNARERARALRREGKTYDEIVAELGVAKSSVSLWVRDLPKPQRRTQWTAHARMMAEARWAPYREERELTRERTKRAAAGEIGPLGDRDLFIAGVALYWAEGAKSKPHRPVERVEFVNSDPDVIRLYLAWLDLLGVERARLRFSVYIHESADVAAAERFWAELAGVEVGELGKTVLKRHNPKTNRKNVGDGYHGCLRVGVGRGADLYRRIVGWWCGIVVAASQRDVYPQG
jgi:transcriptional regulator with XRE-family HTH domain